MPSCWHHRVCSGFGQSVLLNPQGQTIMRRVRFVRSPICIFALCAACQAELPVAGEVRHVQEKSRNEASGLVMSHKRPGVCWTHNDGDDGVLYAIAPDGSTLAKIKVDADFKDWEDIASDNDGHLYLADVGNNSRERKHV